MMFTKPPRGATWAAEAFVGLIDAFDGGIQFINEQFTEPTKNSPDDCKTPEQLRQYAYSIRHSNPSLADDLVAAANRADAD